MPEMASLDFCDLEFREGFMIATLKPEARLSEAETLRAAMEKRKHYGEVPVGLVIYNPGNSPIDPAIFTRAETLMKEQGYSFLIVARPSPSHSKMLELFNKHCLIYVGDTLEDAIAHAEETIRTAACG
jgi:hypothetical protein